MSTPPPVAIESKSAKKRKAKTEAAASNPAPALSTSETAAPPAEAHSAANGVDSLADSSVVRELTKNIRNINKKISSSAKADAVVSENPGVDLDDLVAQKKLNADQKAQILKKPALQSQLSQLEEQLSNFRTFAHELEDKAAKEKLSLLESHQAEITKAKEEAAQEVDQVKDKAVDDALCVIIQFLHGAASKRQVEDAESDEARAFEGALLLVYQGNETALSTLKNLVHGTNDKVNDVQGEPLDFTFAQVKEASITNAQDLLLPTATEPEDDNAIPTQDLAVTAPGIGADSTVAHAGLTELDDVTTIQAAAGAKDPIADADVGSTLPGQTSTEDQAANAVAGGWDPQASIVTDTSATNDEWVQVPRDPAETETGLAATPAARIQSTNSWAEEVGAAATSAEEKPAAENDGFEQVKRERGRGRGTGGHRGGRGEFRGGRGRGGRDGHRGGGNRGNREGQNGGRVARGNGAPRGESKA